MNCTSVSEQQHLQQLLTTEEHGDRKLSQVLWRIQQLLGVKAATMDTTFLRELFLQHLPANVHMVLIPSAGDLNLEQLAELADWIMEMSPTLTIATTQTSTDTTTQLTTQVNELTCHLDELTTQMASAVNTFSRCPRRSPSLAWWRQSMAANNRTTNCLCWYHRKFGEDAKKCQPPCLKLGNAQASC